MFWSNVGLLQRRSDLAAKGRYTIASDVDRQVIDLFFARVVEDEAARATAENAEQLWALCDDLGFATYDDEIRAVLGGDWKVRRDLMGLQAPLTGTVWSSRSFSSGCSSLSGSSGRSVGFRKGSRPPRQIATTWKVRLL